MNKAKTDNQKKKKEASLKSFELMVKYCETAVCRHAVFSRYFDDSMPQCETRCDVCKFPKVVAKDVSEFGTQAAFRRSNGMGGGFRLRGGDEDGSSLYEGGRAGQKRYGGQYSDDEDGEGYEGALSHRWLYNIQYTYNYTL